MMLHCKEPNIVVIHFRKYKQTCDICFRIVRSRIVSLFISESIRKHPTFDLASWGAQYYEEHAFMFGNFFLKTESWGCGLYTGAVYTPLFTVHNGHTHVIAHTCIQTASCACNLSSPTHTQRLSLELSAMWRQADKSLHCTEHMCSMLRDKRTTVTL